MSMFSRIWGIDILGIALIIRVVRQAETDRETKMNSTYSPEQINQMWQELKADGWEFDCWDSRMRGWWIKRSDRRFSYRRGDPKHFTLATINAYEFKQYVTA